MLPGGGHLVRILDWITGALTIVCAKVVKMMPAPPSVDNLNTFVHTIVLGLRSRRSSMLHPLIVVL